MHMWHIKVKMRGETGHREQPAMMKSSEPNKSELLEDLIVDGKIIRAKITKVEAARSGENGYEVSAEEIE